MELEVLVSEQSGISVVSVTGELDAHAAPLLRSSLEPLWLEPAVALVVDLSGVGFIDSTGLGVLVTTLKHVREAGGTLDVVASSPRVLKVFALTGMDVVIPMHATLAEALPPA